ncbi:MAG TPA: hypothetical protein VMM81_06875 [Acidimicrobiia bacterium]|nr:hypothetical protein [Acidimicrobiia bacterium]
MPAADAPRDGTLPLAAHPHRIVIDAGVLVALAGLSLAFVSSGAGGRPWSLRDGVVLLGLLAPLVVLTVLPDRSRPLSPAHRLIGSALVLLAIPYALIKVMEAVTLARAVGGSIGFGPWLVLAGVAAAAVGVGLGWRNPTGHLPLRPRVVRGAPPYGQQPQPPETIEGDTIDPDEPTREVSWLDENPFGEALFDSLELEVPPPRSGDTPPDDYDESWLIEDGSDAFQQDVQPAPPRVADEDDPTGN